MSRAASLNNAKYAFRRAALGVAAQDPNYVREKDDFFPTPLRAVEALLAAERFDGRVWEPACGDGAISRPFEAAGYEVVSTDLVDRGYGQHGVDFLMEWRPRAPNIVTNPPFKLAVPFVRKSLQLTTGKVAMLLKIAFLEGQERGQLFRESPLARVLVFSQRLAFVPGGTIGARKLDGGGMMAFAWFVFDHAHTGKPTLGWL